jgi:hypothetical protein
MEKARNHFKFLLRNANPEWLAPDHLFDFLGREFITWQNSMSASACEIYGIRTWFGLWRRFFTANAEVRGAGDLIAKCNLKAADGKASSGTGRLRGLRPLLI